MSALNLGACLVLLGLVVLELEDDGAACGGHEPTKSKSVIGGMQRYQDEQR